MMINNSDSTAYVDYYNQINKIPVSQVVNTTHRIRRKMLYRALGIHPFSIRGSNVLELGSGTGDNAVVLSELGPSRLTLVDGSIPSYKALKEAQDHGLFKCPVDIIYTNIYNFIPQSAFDLIICEGCSAQGNPHQFFSKILELNINEYGIYALSTADTLSLLPELLRMNWWHQIDEIEPSLRLDFATKLFSPDFSALPGASRSCSDWVIDNILHPRPRNWSFGLDDLLHLIINSSQPLSFMGSSPGFTTDWNWYKNFPSQQRSTNLRVLEQWSSNELYTIDYRISTMEIANEPLPPNLTNEVKSLTRMISANTCNIYTSSFADRCDLISDTIRALKAIYKLILPFESFKYTILSMKASIDELNNLLPSVNPREYRSTFKDWWGRGQQYISLTKDINF